jgi:beta-lactamase regulating signal transducer with metallopeptidase domain
MLGAIALLLLRKSSAATRHLTIILTFVGLCALPAVTPLLPKWHVPFVKVTAPAAKPAQSIVGAGVSRVTRNSPETSTTRVSPAANSTTATTPIDFQSLALVVWATVALFLSSRVLFRLIRLKSMERRLMMSADSELQGVVTQICRDSGKHVLLLEGEPAEPPMTWGHSRPVLLLPCDARSWPRERLTSVLMHELAHIERGDWLTSIFGQFVSAAFWFNPVVWFLTKKMEWESEAAADDQVLSHGISQIQYASHLVDVLRELSGSPKSATAALAMARPGRLDGRVRAILEEKRSRNTVRGIALFGMVAVVSGFVMAIGTATPTFVREMVAERNGAGLSQTRTASNDRPAQNPSIGSSTVSDSPIPPVASVSVWASPAIRTQHKHRPSIDAPRPPAPIRAAATGSVASPAPKAQGGLVSTGDGVSIAPTNDGGSVVSIGRDAHTSMVKAGDKDLANMPEVQSEMSQANKEIEQAFAEARKEMRAQHINVDLDVIQRQALAAAATGQKGAAEAVRKAMEPLKHLKIDKISFDDLEKKDPDHDN